jgi:hypothetical protein
MIRSSIKIGKSRKSSYLDGPWDSLSVGLCAGPVTLLAQRVQALLAANVDGTPNNPNHPWLRRHAAKTCDVI